MEKKKEIISFSTWRHTGKQDWFFLEYFPWIERKCHLIRRLIMSAKGVDEPRDL